MIKKTCYNCDYFKDCNEKENYIVKNKPCSKEGYRCDLCKYNDNCEGDKNDKVYSVCNNWFNGFENYKQSMSSGETDGDWENIIKSFDD